MAYAELNHPPAPGPAAPDEARPVLKSPVASLLHGPLVARPAWLAGFALGQAFRLSRAALHLLVGDGARLDLSEPVWTNLSDELTAPTPLRRG